MREKTNLGEGGESDFQHFEQNQYSEQSMNKSTLNKAYKETANYGPLKRKM